MINQMRIYGLYQDTREAFLDRFRDHAARIMRDVHGFRILAMWETRRADGAPAFAYLLSWRDAAEMAAAWEGFMADAEWAAIKAETAAQGLRMVSGIEDLTLSPTEFSAPLESAAEPAA
ncbi:MAG: NIPSNAP family protein [Pseudomonadota bacterium]